MPIQLVSPPCLPASEMKEGMAVHKAAFGHYKLPVALDSSCVGKPQPRAVLGLNLLTPLHPPAAAHPSDPPCKIGVSADSLTRDPSPSINPWGGRKRTGLTLGAEHSWGEESPWCCPALLLDAVSSSLKFA